MAGEEWVANSHGWVDGVSLRTVLHWASTPLLNYNIKYYLSLLSSSSHHVMYTLIIESQSIYRPASSFTWYCCSTTLTNHPPPQSIILSHLGVTCLDSRCVFLSGCLLFIRYFLEPDLSPQGLVFALQDILLLGEQRGEIERGSWEKG